MIKMEIKDLLFDYFDLYEDDQHIFSKQDIQNVNNLSPIVLPSDYLEFIENVGSISLIYEDALIISFWDVEKIKDWSITSKFSANVPKGIGIGDDLGDMLYYYGEGKDGVGYYVVEKGSEDYLSKAFKFSNSLYEFFKDIREIERLFKWIDTGDST